MITRIAAALIAVTALISSSAAAGDLACERVSWVTDACCTGGGDEAPDRDQIGRACCCDLTPVPAEPTAPNTSGVLSGTTDVPQAAVAVTPPVAERIVSAIHPPPAHARGPPGPSADLLTQRTSLQR